MIATALADSSLTIDKIERVAKSIAIEYIQKWLGICDSFATWHYDAFCRREPTIDEVRARDKQLSYLIHTTALLHSQAVDPNFQERELRDALEATLHQLQLIWDMDHNPMSDAEADKLIAELFPANESGT
jgi:hypothetical protein